MPFTKGNSGNPSGRTPGSPNKITRELRELITGFLMDRFDQVRADFDKLPLKDRARVYIDLLAYVLPKQQATAFDLSVDKLTDQQIDEIIQTIQNNTHA